MRNVFLAIASFLYMQNAFAQNIVSSDCNAPDSIQALYEHDAAVLAWFWSRDNNHVSQHDLKISDSVSNIFQRAIIAFYNAQNMPARDTVIQKLKIHANCDIQFKEFLFRADSNASWMKNLKAEKIPTGNRTLDSIIYGLNLKLKSYRTDNNWANDRAVFRSEKPFNTISTCKKIEELDSVEFAHPNYCIGDGNSIKGSIYTNYTELIYTYGWGDCPSGCIYKRHWKFKVYTNCSVEFVESYGDKLPFTGIEENSFKNLSIYPVPFQDNITISGINAPIQFSIRNILGQVVATGKTENNTITDLETLEKGTYFLNIQSGGIKGNYRLMKN